MKKRLYSSFALIMLATTSSALADGYYKDQAPVTETWTGYYVGLNGGYGWGNQSVGESGSTILGAASIANAIKQNAIPSSLANSPKGGLGGVLIGYNYQVNDMAVIGLEADYDIANISANQTANTNVAGFTPIQTFARQKLESLGTVRARVGYTPAYNPLLIYLTGGFAYGQVETSASISNPGCVHFCGNNSSSNTNSGWAAGIGMEYALATKWSVKAEYLYYDLGSQSQRIVSKHFPGSFLAQNVSFKGNVLRAGVDYKFM